MDYREQLKVISVLQEACFDRTEERDKAEKEIVDLKAENKRVAKYSAKTYKRMDEAMSETLVANAKLSALKAKIAGSQTELLLYENNRFRLQWKDLPLHPTMKMVALFDLTEMEENDD